MHRNFFLDGLLGLAVGDALGVPYEFSSRSEMRNNPATDMIGYGTYNQPEGSWSDDTSMALCSADSLCRGLDPDDMMKKFSAWINRRQYTACGVVFDVGRTCRRAIDLFDNGCPAEMCGVAGEQGNGNGALMRILPISLWGILEGKTLADDAALLNAVHGISALTHAHERGMICCGIYTLFIDEWLHRNPQEGLMELACRAYDRALHAYSAMGSAFADEILAPGRFIHPQKLAHTPEHEIQSGGYVLETLHAAFWCLLTTNDYASCVLKAVNLGGDTDTTAAVAGGLAGLVYGAEGIPRRWLELLKNRELIEDIADRLNQSLAKSDVISEFTGEHRHLALKYSAKITMDGLDYANAQAAYLAQKTLPEFRDQFCGLNAHQARRLARQLPERADWPQVKQEALAAVCRNKYLQNPDLKAKLLATGSRTIIYDTTGAHDNELGRCMCASCADKAHHNLLGCALMELREELFRSKEG